MKGIKVTYWITTIFISLMMLMSVFMYLTAPQVKAGFAHLGYPDYFRVELAIAKFLGVIALLVPVKGRIKEWAYFGFFACFVSAFIAHTTVGDPGNTWGMVLVATAILLTSYFTYHKMNGVVKN